MPIDPRVICSTISLRHRSLPEAAAIISDLGFGAVDLGALPGICEHVPPDLSPAGVGEVAERLAGHGLEVVSVNADIGDLNVPPDPPDAAARSEHLRALLELCRLVNSPALVLPCGWQRHDPRSGSVEEDLEVVAQQLTSAASMAQAAGVAVWVEAQHSGRLCYSTDRAVALMDRLRDTSIGVVMDFSHIIASGDEIPSFVERLGDRVTHVHLRDAVRGNINLSIGRGEVDFEVGIKLLHGLGYSGRYSLELETHDITEAERPAAARAAGEYISSVLNSTN